MRPHLPLRSADAPASSQAPTCPPRPRAGAGGAGSPLDTSDLPSLCLTVDTDRRRPLIQASGELDVHSAPLLQAILDHLQRVRRARAAGATRDRSCRVDVDLTGVTFADSSGLAPALAGNVAVVAASPQVRRVLLLLLATGTAVAGPDRQAAAAPEQQAQPDTASPASTRSAASVQGRLAHGHLIDRGSGSVAVRRAAPPDEVRRRRQSASTLVAGSAACGHRPCSPPQRKPDEVDDA